MFRLIVIGGGVAGAVAAAAHARAGRAVTLVVGPRRQGLHEGLSPRVVEGLKFAGCMRALAEIGPWVERVSHWRGSETRLNGEFVTDRARLDAALVADAGDAGADIVSGRVTRVGFADSGWRVEGKGFALAGDFLVEARGRQAPARGQRRHGPRTTALARGWRFERDRPAISAVAAFRDGWAWFAAPGDGRATMQIVVAGEGLPPRAGIEHCYHQRLADVAEAGHWLNGAVADGPVVARNANAVLAPPPVADAMIRIGDAALAIDPLSGHGMFEAVSTALASIAVVNTVIERPEQRDLARQFFEERVTQAFWRHARIGREFYAGEQRWPDSRFWKLRGVWPDLLPAHEPPTSRPPALVTRPVVENGYVVPREVIVTADHPRGIWQIDGVDVVALMRLLKGGWRGERALIDTAVGATGATAAQVETALAWLRQRGLLLARDAG